MFSSLLLAAFAAPLANAHGTLQYPPARTGQADGIGQKLTPYEGFMDVINTEGPDCGSAKGNIGANPGPIQATFAPGQQIDVQWQITIPHDPDRTNYGVRVAVHYGPGDSYAQNILLDNYDAGTGNFQMQTASVTLPPGKTSETAVLQWVWAAQSDGGFYLGCSDISIVEGGGDAPSDPADPNGPGTAPPGTTDPNGQGTGGASTGTPQGPPNGSGGNGSPQGPPDGSGGNGSPQGPPNGSGYGSGYGSGSNGSPQGPGNGSGSNGSPQGPQNGNGNGGGSGANDPVVVRIPTPNPTSPRPFGGNGRFGGNNRYGGYGGYGSSEDGYGGYGGYGSDEDGYGESSIDICIDCNRNGMQYCAFGDGTSSCLPMAETQFEYACGQEFFDDRTGGLEVNGIPLNDCSRVNPDGTVNNLDDLANAVAAWGIAVWALIILGNVIPLCICACFCVCLYKVFIQKDNISPPPEVRVNNYVEFEEDDRRERRGRRGRGRRVKRMSTRV